MRSAFAARGGADDDLSRFRRLTSATIVATFALILIGGVVRVSDSGLGCGPAGSGTEGWPLCGGRALPFLETNAVIEFSHRAAATVVTILIGAMVLLAWRRLRERSWLVRGSIGAAGLVLAQAGLGGLTVEHGLHEVLVAAHLGLAMLLLGLLIVLRRLAQPPEAAAAQGDSPGVRALAGGVALLLLATIVAGGYVAGTEGEGTANEPAVGAHLACGQQFPTCLDEFMPFGTGRFVDIQLTHRLLVYLTTIALVGLVAMAVRRRVQSRAFHAAAALVPLQILLGATNVWVGEEAALVVAHLALGTVLWATLVHGTASLIPVPEPSARRLRGEREPEAATA